MDKFSSESDLTSLCSELSQQSYNSDYRPQHKSRNGKQLRSKRFKYQNISNELRATLIQKVTEENQKIKPTARKLGINYSTAKSILQIYRKEGRIDKKLVLRAGEQPELTTQDEISGGSNCHDLSLNLKSESKTLRENKRYSLRKRDPTLKETPLLPSLQKAQSTIYEPRKVKKVKISEKSSIEQVISDKSDSTKSHQETSTLEQTTHQVSKETIVKDIPMFEVKNEEDIPKETQNSWNLQKSRELLGQAPTSNEMQRKSNLSIKTMLPVIPSFVPQLNPMSILNLNLYGLLSSQVQQHVAKLILLTANSHHNTPNIFPLLFQSNPSPNFSFNKSRHLGFTPRFDTKN